MEKKDLVNLLNEIFIPLGFKRRGNNWVQNLEEISKIINLQKSNYSNSYYINYDFIIKGLELDGWQSHVYGRLISDNKEEQQLITALLNLENGIDPSERRLQLKKLITKKIVNEIVVVNTVAELGRYVANLTSRRHLSWRVLEHFNIPKEVS